MRVRHDVNVGPHAQDFRMDRPFRMAAARPGQLLAVPIDQDEIAGAHDFAEPDAVALEPEAAPLRIAQRQMAERHVAVALHLEDAAGARELFERFAQFGLGLTHSSVQSIGGRVKA